MGKFVRTILLTTLAGFLSSALSGQTKEKPDGKGTEEYPYEISSLENLYWISQKPEKWDKHFEQTTNIDAFETETWNGGEGWEPIGKSGQQFTGTYNGNDNIIEGDFY